MNRLGAAATQRKLQRVAIQHDKYLNAGLSGKGKETLDASLFFEKIEPSRYTVCSITHTKTRCSIHCYKTSCVIINMLLIIIAVNKKRKRIEY